MILKNCSYIELAEKIKENESRIIIYGAGMIGQVVVPYFINTFELHKYVECYVDMDKRKEGRTIQAGNFQYKICHPDCLITPIERLVVLITNSKFYPVIEYLDRISGLKSTECYLIPLMQKLQSDIEQPIAIRRLSTKPLIPKKIHYCWFGKKKMPKFLSHCMNTWSRYCPDYEIICWNEDNYDLDRIPFAKEAYRQKKYGFVTDAVRLDILYEQGGIYMDTDVSLMKNLDELLYQPAFVGVEKWGNINTGGLSGAMPKHSMVKEMLEYRAGFHFVLEDGSLNMETNGIYETVSFIKHGLKIDNSMQYINNVTVYPSRVFHPYDYMSCEEKIDEWTFSKHHFYGGWMDELNLLERYNTQKKYNDILKRIKLGGKPDYV